MKYKHLSYSDRQEMEKLYLQGWHMNDIAAKLGVSLATVYHERARGDTGKMDKNGRGGYSAELAQSKIYARRQELQERIKGGSQKWKCGTLRSRPARRGKSLEPIPRSSTKRKWPGGKMPPPAPAS